MSEGNIEKITESGSNFAPTFVGHHVVPDTTFNGQCLIKNNISSFHIKVIKPYISYMLIPWLIN